MKTQAGGSSYHATDGSAYEVFLGRWTRPTCGRASNKPLRRPIAPAHPTVHAR
jgi:hypothetical protein